MEKLKQGEWGYTLFPWPGDVDIQVMESMIFKLKKFLVIKELSSTEGLDVIEESGSNHQMLNPRYLFRSPEAAIATGVKVVERRISKLQKARGKIQKLSGTEE